MMDRIKNAKWRTPIYHFAGACLTLALGLLGWMYLPLQAMAEDKPLLLLALLFALLLIGPSIGFWAARGVQRDVDRLHLAIKQAGKGNLSERIPSSGSGGFEPIFRDFNEMSESLEGRIKLLRKLGEEHVMIQAQSNEAAVLEERKRLARDLHDTVSQQLFAIHMSASSLVKLLDVRPEAVKTVVDQLVTMSQHAQKQMRSLIAQLRPLELEGKTLHTALDQWFPVYCSQNELQGELDLRIKGKLSDAIEHQLFLVIQEAMANVVKHARARRVLLLLHDAGRQIVLQIDDDGIGFEPGGAERSSYGLSTMKERAQRLGGDAEIRSLIGKGTTVKISIPKFVS
ncbi:HAMP domain-containing sensor histidine kinase [Paenibacillus sp. MBLB4367]|uniref:HAMP domain-containing sensor histidine kinase n=1 Tax=Paenibacillus sp. MBLB4367 TaxID=3384767 RepID=UPI00390827C2